MAKILVALDQNTSFVKDLTCIARELIQDMDQHLFMALLVKDLAYTSAITSYVKETSLFDYAPGDKGLLTEEDKKKTEVISSFEHEARKAGMKYQIYHDFKVTPFELVKQTTYADLLVLSYDIFFNHITNKPDTSLLYQVLKGSRCPVLIVPSDISAIDNIIFTYDGKESSVFAIRAFGCLFAKTVKNKEVTILTVSPNIEEEIKNEKFLLDLVKQHFNNVGLQLLTGTSISGEILNFAGNVQNPLVIMGAYGRSTVSNLIIPSVARRIIESQKTPLFIAHR